MTYEVLARRLRPSRFSELIGQDQTVRALANALDSDRLHHAYLFTGTRGVGKTTVARILAKCLNCEQGVTSDPCGNCSACTEIKENRFMDLIEVDAASRTGVDDTRDLLENAQYLPSKGRFKVYLIDEVHMLSTASFNALLKTLEEPPGHIKFLLATTDPKKVPVTVLSRCLQFQLRNLSTISIADYLKKILDDEDVGYDIPAVEVIAKNAQGSVRDALSLTDQAIAFGNGNVSHSNVVDMLGVVGRDEVNAMLEALDAGSSKQIMKFSAGLAERNTSFSELLKGMIELLHEMAVDLSLGKEIAKSFTSEELQLYYQIALVGLRDINIVPDERSGFEMTMLRMLAFAPEQDSAVPKRINGENQKEANTDESSFVGNKSEDQSLPEISEDFQNKIGPETSSEVLGSEKSESMDELVGIDISEWAKRIEAMDLGGISRMIAENSLVMQWDLPKVQLMLDQDHDTLLSPQLVDELSEALTKLENTKISLSFEVGLVDVETVAKMKIRKEKERQTKAEAAINGDPTISGILGEFGGEIKEIKPIG
ncbi:DNA polymerase III subunit gamma/tau [Gammaproteobacteria bacterium]|nr:DNA polymerase III subunit gamma/tau [Gammaproteobacteria bacterium]